MSWNTIKTVKSSPIRPLTLKSLKLKLNKISWQVVHQIWTARIGISFYFKKNRYEEVHLLDGSFCHPSFRQLQQRRDSGSDTAGNSNGADTDHKGCDAR